MTVFSKIRVICLALALAPALAISGCAVYAPPLGVEVGFPVGRYYGHGYYGQGYYSPRYYGRPYYYGQPYGGYYRRW